jgi:hypothetical protein
MRRAYSPARSGQSRLRHLARTPFDFLRASRPIPDLDGATIQTPSVSRPLAVPIVLPANGRFPTFTAPSRKWLEGSQTLSDPRSSQEGRKGPQGGRSPGRTRHSIGSADASLPSEPERAESRERAPLVDLANKARLTGAARRWPVSQPANGEGSRTVSWLLSSAKPLAAKSSSAVLPSA